MLSYIYIYSMLIDTYLSLFRSRIAPIEDVQVTEDLTYVEIPIAILDR